MLKGGKRNRVAKNTGIINKINGMKLRPANFGLITGENILLMTAETIFPSESKGTETTLDDVQGKNETMYVRVFWQLHNALHI